MNEQILRGDVYLADLDEVPESEQGGGIRPVIIIQNNKVNYHSPATMIAPITTKLNKSSLPSHISINRNAGLDTLSIVMLEQIRVIDKTRLLEKRGTISHYKMQCLNRGLLISVGILLRF